MLFLLTIAGVFAAEPTMTPKVKTAVAGQPVSVVLQDADADELVLLHNGHLLQVERQVQCQTQCVVSFEPGLTPGDVLVLAHPRVLDPNGAKGPFSIKIPVVASEGTKLAGR